MSSLKNASITSFFRPRPKGDHTQNNENQISLFTTEEEDETEKNGSYDNTDCKIEGTENDVTKIDTTASEPDYVLTQNGTPNRSKGVFGDEDIPLSRKRSLLFEEEINPPKVASTQLRGLDFYEYNEQNETESVTVGKEHKKDKEDSIDYNERELYINCKASKMSRGFRDYVDNYYRYKGTFSFPPWVEVKNIRDIDGRKPTEEDYRPNTLWIPPKNHKWANEYRSGHYTECMQQWWNIKQNHFDSLVFFKMGKFYELFYHDACIIQSIVNLRWMGSETKPHVGFPEKSLHTYAKACVDSGYKVVVVEQTETPQQLEKRNKESGSYNKAVKRDVCEIITAGTVTRPEMLDRQSRPLVLVSKESENRMAVISIDVSMNKMKFGSLKGQNRSSHQRSFNHHLQVSSSYQGVDQQRFGQRNEQFSQLRTILMHLCPAEVVLDRELMQNQELVKMIKVLPYAPEVASHYAQQDQREEIDEDVYSKKVYTEKVYSEKVYSEKVYSTLLSHNGNGESNNNNNGQNNNNNNGQNNNNNGESRQRSLYEKVVQEYPVEGEECICALALAESYLKLILLDKLVEYCYVEPLNVSEMEVMNMDYSALTHLELFYTQEGSTKNSLFDYLNNTVTPFGERMLRTWLLNPLTNVEQIDLRSECVSFLLENYPLVTTIKQDLDKFPDLERSLGKVLNAASNLHKKAVYFDEGVFSKLYELYTMLDRFKKLEDMVLFFLNESAKMFSTSGLQTNPARAEGAGCSKSKFLASMRENYISCSQDVFNYKSMLVFTEDKKCRSKSWPRSMSIQEEIDKVVNKLKEVLSQIQQSAPSATFVNCKFRYEVEMTETEFHRYNSSRGNSMEITSTRSGFIRARNETIVELIDELEQAEFKLKETEEEFYQHIVSEFHKNSYKFCKLIETASVLDCLASLATVARNSPFQMVRPRVYGKEKNVLKVKDSVYPLFAANISMTGFVPNDLCIGDFEECKTPIIIITGPNMGGKSTLLRQIALTVIMGQMGSFVSASSCEFSVVDSVFTRLGASDNLVEGKSTFLVELQDISNILLKATSSSLALIDELGRGTSTFDGTAIAAATLEKISKIGCRCVFTTHFQDVCRSAREFKNVTMYHMAARVDEQEQTVEFLYKLVPGICPDSHGLHVAKLAKIPDHVLRTARSARLRLIGGNNTNDNDTPENNKSDANVDDLENEKETSRILEEEEKYEKIGDEIARAHQSGNTELLHDIYIKYSI
ncbi:hypothetical protein MACJ_000162 [Theileria orientalis]|uniref:DNA mismatch repair protein n=1 Tax=Theileria orientalis TaxID=68886 RepID=A0A976QUC8_THEOR|nr:hypothetical protein MACJ_000162 [Theileria orientalis]